MDHPEQSNLDPVAPPILQEGAASHVPEDHPERREFYGPDTEPFQDVFISQPKNTEVTSKQNTISVVPEDHPERREFYGPDTEPFQIEVSAKYSRKLLFGQQDNAVQQARDTREIVRLEDAIGRDPDTGLYRKKAWLNYIEARIKAEPNLEWGIIFLDMKDFKRINDEHPGGHEKGDQIILDIASFLSHNRRNTDAARLGGDEFGLFIDLTPRQTLFHDTEPLHAGDDSVINTPEGRLSIVADLVVVESETYLTANQDLRELNLDISVGSALHQANESTKDTLLRSENDMKRHKGAQRDKTGHYR